MRIESMDDMAARIHEGAGEQEDAGIYVYQTEVTISISIPTGPVVCESEAIAKAVALGRAEQWFEVRGSGCSVEQEAAVGRIRPA